MKYIKKFENINELELEVGDYILMNVNLQENEHKYEINNFVNNTIGKVDRIYKSDDIRVYYENIPSKIIDWFSKLTNDSGTRLFNKRSIVEFSKNQEDLKLKIQTNKYNL